MKPVEKTEHECEPRMGFNIQNVWYWTPFGVLIILYKYHGLHPRLLATPIFNSHWILSGFQNPNGIIMYLIWIFVFQYLYSNTLIKYSLSLFYSLYSAICYFNDREKYAKTRIFLAIFCFNLAILGFVLSIFGFDMQILPYLCT